MQVRNKFHPSFWNLSIFFRVIFVAPRYLCYSGYEVISEELNPEVPYSCHIPRGNHIKLAANHISGRYYLSQ